MGVPVWIFPISTTTSPQPSGRCCSPLKNALFPSINSDVTNLLYHNLFVSFSFLTCFSHGANKPFEAYVDFDKNCRHFKAMNMSFYDLSERHDQNICWIISSWSVVGVVNQKWNQHKVLGGEVRHRTGRLYLPEMRRETPAICWRYQLPNPKLPGCPGRPREGIKFWQ